MRLSEIGSLRFKPDPNAFLFGELLDLGRHIVGFVVDHAIGAPALAQLRFLGRANGGDHFRADGLGHLHDHGADAAGAAVNEDGFAGLEPGTAEQAVMGRDADQRRPGCHVIGDSRGDREEPIFGRADKLRATALPTEQTLIGGPDTLADLESLDVRADRFDDAGHIAAGDERHR